MKILVVEDNPVIGKQLVEFLNAQRWTVDLATTGELAISLCQQEIFDIVLLDLNLPGIDGLAVCQAIKHKAERNTPVLMLTARDAFEDKAKGFATGADDYLTKPYDLREVALRCQALTRRQDLLRSNTLQIGELTLHTADRTAFRHSQPLKLTQTGFIILKTLMEAYPEAVSRRVLMHNIWGDDIPDSDALKSHMYSLRNVVDKPFDKALIKTILNLGFKLDIS
ncbi:response regulator transcription factor [Thalassotalea marina]|uniref:DNA-binding response regulator n=1 Tax=Thalassotalea marina TaxID=1673741 RepID=A0A919BNC9_9GAMM|nr:response regulator transcription factor [Thalassotalea marina]GHF99003.1 DNA-binding response regulator [Thalassotalea marina]